MDGTGRLSVRTARDGDRVLVEIGDNGPGIPEAAAAHILEPFSTTKPVGRAPASGSTAAGGSSSGATATCASPRPRATPASRCRCPSPRAGDAGPGAQTGSRRSPPWAATAQITKMSRVMMSSDQNG